MNNRDSNIMEVDLHISCVIDQFYPELGFSMIKILNKAGVTIHYPEGQTCCGKTAFTDGYWDEAKRLGEKFITEFNNNRLVVSASPGCIGYVKNQFDELFYNGAFHNEYKQLQRNAIEIADFLVNVLNKTDFGAVFNHRAAFVKSCSTYKNHDLKSESLLLLGSVNGLQLADLEGVEDCFDLSGMFSSRFEPIAIAMIKQVTDSALNAGVEYLIVNDPVCRLHLESYISKQSLPLQVVHLVDVLAAGWDD